MNSDRLFLLDAYALIFRAYYALIKMPRLTRSGFNTSAIFGFVNTLEEVIRRENPSHLAVCFDPSGPTFRHKMLESYKGEREATPEDIKLSVPIIKEIVRAYRIPVLEVEGYEADDVIGTVATKAAREGMTTYMMTPDKDFGQLVTDRILQYKPSYRGQDFELRGVNEVCSRYGLENPRQVIDLLALMGDKIDNIPGCPGVGEKTAVKLIGEFHSVENLLSHTDALKGALRRKVEDNADQIRLSYDLATIRTDVPVATSFDELKVEQPDREELFSIFRRLEFNTLMERVKRRLDADATQPSPSAGPVQMSLFDTPDMEPAKATAPRVESPVEVITVDSPEALDALSEAIVKATEYGLYIVSDGDGDVGARWIATAIATERGKAFIIPADYRDGHELVLDIIAREDATACTASSKRDIVMAVIAGSRNKMPLGRFFDVALAHYLLQPETSHSIEALAADFLGSSPLPFPAPPRRGARKGSITDIPLAELAIPAAQRADSLLALAPVLREKIEQSDSLTKLLFDVEMPLARVLADMELTGVRIDTAALAEAAESMELKLKDLEKEIHSMAGVEFNVSSPAKVGEILFDRLALDPKAKKTRTGQYSTSEDILEKLIPVHPIAGKIIEYRQVKKLLSTYLYQLPDSINPTTGKIHTVYNQTVTATGRISSSNPNLQNIPVRDEIGREIRRAFIADPGCLFLSADYSQIELRLAADFSGDPVMIEAFREGKDIHAITAAKIYHKPLEEVTSTERRAAKTANFGILYGISAFGLAQRLGIPRQEAKQLIDGYFATFPTIERYMHDMVEHARENGFVTTRMGRRRILSDINSKNPTVRSYAERNAINAPLQGTAADIIKVAMVRIDREMRERRLKSKMIMQVHDELNFNVPEDEVPVMQELIERIMPQAYSGAVPLPASCGVGSNWLEAH